MPTSTLFLSDVIKGVVRFMKAETDVLILDDAHDVVISTHEDKDMVFNICAGCGCNIIETFAEEGTFACNGETRIDPTLDRTCHACIEGDPCDLCIHGSVNYDRWILDEVDLQTHYRACEDCDSVGYPKFQSIWMPVKKRARDAREEAGGRRDATMSFILVMDIDDTICYPSPFTDALLLAGDDTELMERIKHSPAFKRRLLEARLADWYQAPIGDKLVREASEIILVTGRPEYLREVTLAWFHDALINRIRNPCKKVSLFHTPYTTPAAYKLERQRFLSNLVEHRLEGEQIVYAEDNVDLYYHAVSLGIQAIQIRNGNIHAIYGWPRRPASGSQ